MCDIFNVDLLDESLKTGFVEDFIFYQTTGFFALITKKVIIISDVLARNPSIIERRMVKERRRTDQGEGQREGEERQ